jgi:hypothetical protein
LRRWLRRSSELRESHTEGYQCHPPGFANWSTPEWIVVSGGPRDRLDAVATAYQTRGARVMHAADRGAIQATIANGQVAVDSFRALPE